MNRKRAVYQFMAKALVIVMIFQGMPLWELSNAYKWEFDPGKLQRISDVLSVFGPSEAQAVVLTDEYTITATAAQADADSWVFTYKVTNNNQYIGYKTGFDGLIIQMPETAEISDLVLPPTYSSGYGYWFSYFSTAEYHGNAPESPLLPGYKWLVLWGGYTPSLYPSGTTAVFSFKADNVTLGQTYADAVTYWNWIIPPYPYIDIPPHGRYSFFSTTLPGPAPLYPPHPPTAVIGTPCIATVGEEVQADGSGSYDIDESEGDSITAWDWETDFAEPYDFADAHGEKLVLPPYTSAGVYSLGLRVTDNTAAVFSGTDLKRAVYGEVRVYRAGITDLRGRPKGTKCQLVWPHIGVSSYEVLRSEKGPNHGFETIGTTGSTYSTFIDYNVVLKTDYWYRIRAELDEETVLSGPFHVYSRGEITNYPPVFSTEPVTSGRETVLYQYDADASDPEGGAVTYILDQFPSGMLIDASAGLITWTPGIGQAGLHDVTLRVQDQYRASASQFFQIMVAPRPNDDPLAVPGGPYSGVTEQEITFDGSASSDPDSDAITDYHWNFGDGNTAHGAAVSHTYTAPGTFTVTLFVTDERGATGSATATCSVTRPPVAKLGGPYEVRKGTVIQFDGSMSYDPDGDDLTYSWDFGDSSPSETGAGASHAYTSGGNYQVTLTADDGKGGTDSAVTLVWVTDTDLEPANIDLSGVSADSKTPKLTGTVSVGIFNRGTTAAEPGYDVTLFEDTDSNGLYSASGDNTIGIATVSEEHAGGALLTLEISVNSGVLFSGNRVFAFADSGNVTDETDESNNITHNMTDCTFVPPAPDESPSECIDLTASRVRADKSGYPGSVKITARFGNGGAVLIGPGAYMSFYDGDPEAGGTLLGTAATSGDMNPGEYEDISLTLNSPQPGILTVRAAADDDGTGTGRISETDEDNNTASGEFHMGNRDPVIVGEPVTEFTSGSGTYVYNVTAYDPDGDTLTYTLTNSPDGMTADSAAGTVTWEPTGAQTGIHNVSVRVWDGKDGTDIQHYTVRVLSPIDVYPLISGNPVVGSELTFTVSDPSGLTCEWDFGDGYTAAGSEAVHTYGYPGNYDVVLHAADSEGNSADIPRILYIGTPYSPTASVSVSGYMTAGKTLSFDGSGSYGHDAVITAYNWDFGDGDSGAGHAVSHIYADPGNYRAVLTVTDSAGRSSSVSLTLMIGPGRAPVADFGYSGVMADGNPIFFDASGSYDPEEQGLSYAWIFGDGSAGSGVMPDHTFAVPGDYTVILTVTDSQGQTDCAAKTVTVGSSAGPLAKFTVSGAYSVGRPISFDGSLSSGDIASYSWDFGDRTTTTGVQAEHTYTEGGVYTAVLRVTGTSGAWSEAHGKITVSDKPNQNPAVQITCPAKGIVSEAAVFSAAAADPDGDTLVYSWNFGDGTSGTGASAGHAYASAG
ncbi:MAG: PKD domain-containing protein, partial [Desulfobacterales bacterium]|nr:PKD domain-containing protein [Desulfobacterales bacterium]